jgi:hypothetical protein
MEYTEEITSLEDLHKVLQAVQTNPIKLSGASQYYRGHGCSSYKLLSNISRFYQKFEDIQSVEETLLRDLKVQVEQSKNEQYFYTPKHLNGFDADWYWLTQAQHLGIPTRLLDWTLNGEIALYFAVSGNSCKDKDGDLWAFFIPQELNIYNQDKSISDIKPFQTDKDLFVNIPTQWNTNYEKNEPQRNIVNQQGKFFIRCLSNSLIALEDESIYKKYLFRYKIPSKSKEHICNELADLNYNPKTVFKTFDPEMNNLKNRLIDTYNLRAKK